MQIPGDRWYSDHHLWVKINERHAVIGITEYAREELGEIDYVELPAPDQELIQNEPFGIIETSKAVTDLIAPISGTVLEANPGLSDSPNIVTNDPYASGWLLKVVPSNPEDLGDLMKASDYEKLLISVMEERSESFENL